MTAVQAIAVLIVRIWAFSSVITLMFVVASTAGILVFEKHQFQGSGQLFMSLISTAFLLAFWTVVLCYSKKVTLWVLPPAKEQNDRLLIGPEDLLRVGTILIGIFYLVEYLPKLLSRFFDAISYYAIGKVGLSPIQIWRELGELAATLLVLLIALWLIVRSHHIVRLFAWLRTAGQPNPNPPPESQQKAD